MSRMQARDYQVACHDAVLAEWGIPEYAARIKPTSGEPVHTTVANLATSAGKTIIASFLIETLTQTLPRPYAGRTLFLADSDELCQQPIDKLHQATGIFAQLEKASSTASLNAEVVVASVQTLDKPNRRQRYPRGHFRYAIVDEAHRNSDRVKKILEEMGVDYRLGITATAFRSNMKDLGKYYETVCFEMPQYTRNGKHGLTELGYLTPVTVLQLPITVDLTNVKISQTTEGEDYNAEELGSTIEPHFEEICHQIKEHAPERQIISFLPLRKISERFAQIARANGISARHVEGGSADREEVTSEFAHRRFQMICNSMLLTTGWDCPPCDCLLNLRATRSVGLYWQLVGRIIRVLPGVIDGLLTPEERRKAIAASAKKDALILDVLWQYKDLMVAGPGSLIANSEEEADLINQKLKELTKGDLEDVMQEVIRDKEEALRKQLERQARRSKSMFSAMELAVSLHQMELVEFEPTMPWHEKPISDAQRNYIARLGIDPEGVNNRGHASVLLDTVLKREESGFATIKQLVAIRNAGGSVDPFLTADRAASAVMALASQQEDLGSYEITFGRHAGKPLSELPVGWLRWAKENLQPKKHPEIFGYIAQKGI